MTDHQTTRHPKIIEDSKAIEVVLRLEETTRSTTGTAENATTGRRFTVTAVGAHLGSEHRRSTIVSASIAAGNNLAVPLATEQRRSEEVETSSRTSSETVDDEEGEGFVPIRTTITNTQYLPHLEAIEEMLPGALPGSLRDQSMGRGS